jgi:uncharacterized protein YcgI (DUF1989 family)
MLTVVEHTWGPDFLRSRCSTETFNIPYPHRDGGPHRGCRSNLASGLGRIDAPPDPTGTTLTASMNTRSDAHGELRINPPNTAAGAQVTAEAEINRVVEIPACSAKNSHEEGCKPIDDDVAE